MGVLNNSTNPRYTSVNVIIFTVAEVFVGVFTASLPPLRKTFESVLDKVLPYCVNGSSKISGISHMLKEVGSHVRARMGSVEHECEGDGERGILPEGQASRGEETEWVIRRTVTFSVTSEAWDKSTMASMKRREVWE